MRKPHYLAMVAWGVAACWAADRDPAAVLKEVTAKVLAREAALPNYTCVETVTRDYYEPKTQAAPQSCAALTAPQPSPASGPPLTWTVTDRLRLDVTIIAGGEIYSWVGASKFEEGGIDQVVKEGPIGTGSFGALILLIFQQDVRTFQFKRYVLDRGRGLMEYSFEVGKEASRYMVKTGDSWINTAYSGTLQADPETDEVIRITVQTAELPPATNNCQTTTTMGFNLTRMGDNEFLLPKDAWQRFVRRNGDAVENTTNLYNCREYKGESTISFSGKPELVGADGQPAASHVQFPPGLPFSLELTTTISTDTVAAGDSFAGRLVNALRDSKGKTLAPAHAKVEGRVERVEIGRTFPTRAVVALRLTTIEIGGAKIPLSAKRKDGPLGDRRKKTAIVLPLPGEQHTGIFRFSGGSAVMPAGFRSDWQTTTDGEGAQGSK